MKTDPKSIVEVILTFCWKQLTRKQFTVIVYGRTEELTNMASSGMKDFYRQKKKGGVTKAASPSKKKRKQSSTLEGPPSGPQILLRHQHLFLMAPGISKMILVSKRSSRGNSTWT